METPVLCELPVKVRVPVAPPILDAVAEFGREAEMPGGDRAYAFVRARP